jgi:hypothetical protein
MIFPALPALTDAMSENVKRDERKRQTQVVIQWNAIQKRQRIFLICVDAYFTLPLSRSTSETSMYRRFEGRE